MMDALLLEQMLAHARAEAPRESCGIVANNKYFPCKNISPNPDGFEIEPRDYVVAEAAGEITAIVHSHPSAQAAPSDADKIGIESTGLLWIIVCPDDNSYTENYPTGYVMPLYGRTFKYGTVDCFTYVRDYWKRIFGVELKDYSRPKRRDYALGQVEAWGEENGFTRVRELQMHDVIGMSIEVRGPDAITNHLAVYLGNNKIGQHCLGHKSMKYQWGGYWQDVATGFWRRK